MGTLMTIYMATAIFGGGVILTDLFGLLHFAGQSGDHEGDDDAGGDHADDGDHTDEGADDADHGEDAQDADQDSDQSHTQQDGNRGATLMHGKTDNKRLIVRFIGLLKNTLYFAFGFGAVGWFALASDYTALGSLAWSVPIGAGVMIAARLIKRLQKHELNSQFDKKDLLMAEAEVLVSISPGQIGKVRIKYEGLYLDRYAKTFEDGMAFKKGDTVRIMDINEEFVFVSL